MMKIPRNTYKPLAYVLLSGVFLGFTWLLIKTTTAQEGAGQGLEISPPVMALTADPGKTVKANILVRNVTSTDLVVTGESNDFVAAGEDGTPKVLLGEDETSPYSIKDWITIPGKVTLVPREIKTMNVAINVPADASPGGHYGVVRFTGTPPSLEGQGVALTASLGSLILLSVSGDITQQLSIEEFSANKDGQTGTFFESLPINLVERLKNSGNVHERPAGAITIRNMFNKTVATFPYNPQARYVLPDSTRKFEQTLNRELIGDKRLFGKYTATLSVTYGEGNDKTADATLTFWIIPWKLILGVIAAIIIGFFLIRFAIRRYNQYVIKRSNKHHR